MKRIILINLLALICTATCAQGISINNSGNEADVSAMLDIVSTTGGLLIPRMTESDRDAINSPATSLLIYQTDNNSGFYFYDGTGWTPLINGGGAADSVWSTKGNRGTTAGVNFLGTTDNEDLSIATNSSEKLRIKTNGRVGIGTVSPSEMLDVNGNVEIQRLIIRSNSVSTTSDISMTANAHIETGASMTFSIDSDNNNTSDYIGFGTNSASRNGSFNELMRIQENGNVGIGTVNPEQQLDVSGNLKLSGAFMPGNNAGTSGQVLTSSGAGASPVWTTSSSIPVGMIMLWSGSTSNIPSGWALCDGSNGTPDLRNRFVVGAGSSYTVGATGGQDNVALSTANLPSHNHNYRDRYMAEWNTYTNSGLTIASEYHGNNFRGSASTDSDNDYFMYVNKTTENAGSGTSHENRPPYYALCYVMKL